MFSKLLARFQKPKPVVVEQPQEAKPVVAPKYSRTTHKLYHEVMFMHDKKGRRAIVRFYHYDNSVKPDEVVIEESNPDTLLMKVNRLVEQRMSKGKR